MSNNKKLDCQKLYLVYSNGNAFYQICKYIRKNLSKPSIGSPLPTMFTNGSFAVEQYLKFILGYEFGQNNNSSNNQNNAVKIPITHDLVKLFEKLSGESQDKIIKAMRSNKKEFKCALGVMSDSFRTWRYFYEKGSVENDHVFLFKLLIVLDKYCELIIKREKIPYNIMPISSVHTEPVTSDNLSKSMDDLIDDFEKNFDDSIFK